jgi:hypothetical protein
MQGEPQHQVFETGGQEAQFFTTTFLKSEPTGSHAERGYWSWMADGVWKAPTNEKLAFAGERALYKLYVFGTIPVVNRGRTDHDFCGDFIRAFIPALETALRPGLDRAERLRGGKVVGEAAKPASKPAEAPAEKAAPKA